MADIIDNANDNAERQLSEQIAIQRAKAGESLSPTPTGYCLNPVCAEDVTDGRLFCGPSCAHEYERFLRK